MGFVFFDLFIIGILAGGLFQFLYASELGKGIVEVTRCNQFLLLRKISEDVEQRTARSSQPFRGNLWSWSS